MTAAAATWALLLALCAALGWALVRARNAELAAMGGAVGERRRARERGSDRARLQHPHIDLSRCMGCGTCVRACPEEGVLEIVHGQAVVVHGARCVGHGRCAAECPVGAIALTLGDLGERKDIPALTPMLESAVTPGLFLAGEVTGYALVRTAIAHGVAVAREVARRKRERGARPVRGALDLCIVGAGPAGIACALEAKAGGLSYVVLEQEALGGTVAKYPRQKLVMTQPIELPLVGTLRRTTYAKEELMELWERIVTEHALPIRTGEELTGVERVDGGFRVRTRSGAYDARHVCLALGRRGTPRKLGVPGEELGKVAYSLLDARSYQGRHVLVVGGGDSAVEAALALAEQPGNEVVLSYRKSEFTRLKGRNERRIKEAFESGRVRLQLASEVRRIEPGAVELEVGPEGAREVAHLRNDEVFVMAGGTPPFELLERAGVSFDPARRPPAEPLVAQGTGLRRALTAALAVALSVLAWTRLFSSYYDLPLAARVDSPWHDLLRPSRGIGLALGVGAAFLIGANLAYLVRRASGSWLRLGSLQAWMSAHVATGIGALLFALLHAAFAPKATVGGHALAALAVLVGSGAIGRYFYAWVPRAANGRDLELEEVQASLAAISSEWDAGRGDFGERVRAEVQALVDEGRWRGTFLARVKALVSGRARLRHSLDRLRHEGRAEGVPEGQVRALLALARRAHRMSVAAAHYEELRAVLSTWRYVHRWVALLLVLLVVLHVAAALEYAAVLSDASPR